MCEGSLPWLPVGVAVSERGSSKPRGEVSVHRFPCYGTAPLAAFCLLSLNTDCPKCAHFKPFCPGWGAQSVTASSLRAKVGGSIPGQAHIQINQ